MCNLAYLFIFILYIISVRDDSILITLPLIFFFRFCEIVSAFCLVAIVTGPNKQIPISFSDNSSTNLLTDVSTSSTLGSGEFGTVYKASWKGITVAVKLLKSTETSVENKLLKEAELLSYLNHPHVIRYFGVTKIDSFFGIVMEYATDQLSSRLENLTEQSLTDMYL